MKIVRGFWFSGTSTAPSLVTHCLNSGSAIVSGVQLTGDETDLRNGRRSAVEKQLF